MRLSSGARVRLVRRGLRHGWARVPAPVQGFVGWLRSPGFVTTSSSLGFWIAGWFLDGSALTDLGTAVDSRSPDRLPVADVLRALIEVADRTGPVAAIAAIWPATTDGAALARAFTAVAPDAQHRIRGWRGRLLALGLIALLPLVVFCGLAALFPVPQVLGPGVLLALALGAGALLVLGVVIGVVYAMSRLRDTSTGDVATGAVIATGLIGASTGGYLVYLRFADVTQRYGATGLATAVLLGLWLLLANASLLVGCRLMLKRAAHRDPAAPDPRPAEELAEPGEAEDRAAHAGPGSTAGSQPGRRSPTSTTS